MDLRLLSWRAFAEVFVFEVEERLEDDDFD
jgi:hypothetical protein